MVRIPPQEKNIGHIYIILPIQFLLSSRTLLGPTIVDKVLISKGVTNRSPRLLNGSDIRRYRKSLGFSQVGFAKEVGLAQSTLSQIEGGRIPLSEEHLELIADKFKRSKYSPTFPDFIGAVESGRAASSAALTTPHGQYSTLTVWAWEPGFELGRAPLPELAVDLVTVGAVKGHVIAFRMNKRTKWWADGEIIVFETCRPQDLDDGRICLVQTRTSKRSRPKTAVAVAHVRSTKSGRSVQLEPASSPGPIFVVADCDILALLRAIYRGRHLA
jgi:transcriptional regulator with XRE-family HTH domain